MSHSRSLHIDFHRQNRPRGLCNSNCTKSQSFPALRSVQNCAFWWRPCPSLEPKNIPPYFHRLLDWCFQTQSELFDLYKLSADVKAILEENMKFLFCALKIRNFESLRIGIWFIRNLAKRYSSPLKKRYLHFWTAENVWLKKDIWTTWSWQTGCQRESRYTLNSYA